MSVRPVRKSSYDGDRVPSEGQTHVSATDAARARILRLALHQKILAPSSPSQNEESETEGDRGSFKKAMPPSLPDPEEPPSLHTSHAIRHWSWATVYIVHTSVHPFDYILIPSYPTITSPSPASSPIPRTPGPVEPPRSGRLLRQPAELTRPLPFEPTQRRSSRLVPESSSMYASRHLVIPVP
ncbi:hypothetical protein CDD83_2404 [Cordyceps sp. RAO-2017]|nr:hypothetical protein CDD83_2404 [Cordyceps sp. RAO-2017]